MRVFCLGPPRSGTVTLHTAFTRAGLNSCHGSIAGGAPPAAVWMWRAFLEDRDPLYYFPPQVEAVADVHLTRDKKWGGTTLWPAHAPAFLRAFRDHNPDVLLLLNTRETSAWVSSVSRWKDLRSRIAQADLPFLPPGKLSDETLALWIENYYWRVRMTFGADPNFLEVAIEDPETPRLIEKALGITLPWWGVANANPPPGEDAEARER